MRTCTPLQKKPQYTASDLVLQNYTGPASVGSPSSLALSKAKLPNYTLVPPLQDRKIGWLSPVIVPRCSFAAFFTSAMNVVSRTGAARAASVMRWPLTFGHVAVVYTCV